MRNPSASESDKIVSIIRAIAGEPGIPTGFPILFDAAMAIIEPAFVWLMEHAMTGKPSFIYSRAPWGWQVHGLR